MTDKLTKTDIEIYFESAGLEEAKAFGYKDKDTYVTGATIHLLNKKYDIPSFDKFLSNPVEENKKVTKYTKNYLHVAKLAEKYKVELSNFNDEVILQKIISTTDDLSDFVCFLEEFKDKKYGDKIGNEYVAKEFNAEIARKEISSGRSVKNFIETRIDKKDRRIFGDLETLDEIKFSLTTPEQKSFKTAKYLYGFSYNQKFIFPMSKYYSVDEFDKLTDNYYFDVISDLQRKYFKNCHVDFIPKILDKYWYTFFELKVATDIAKKLGAKEIIWFSDGEKTKHSYNLRYTNKKDSFIEKTVSRLNKIGWESKVENDFDYDKHKDVFYVDCRPGLDFMIRDNRYILNCLGAVVHDD